MAKFNRHHELFIRADFEKNRYCRELRNRPELIVPMEVETHNELHEYAPRIEVFRPDEAKRILELMDWTGNYIENLDMLMHVIDQVVSCRIGEQALKSLDLQKQFIKEGAYSLDMNKQPPTKVEKLNKKGKKRK